MSKKSIIYFLVILALVLAFFVASYFYKQQALVDLENSENTALTQEEKINQELNNFQPSTASPKTAEEINKELNAFTPPKQNTLSDKEINDALNNFNPAQQ